MSTAKTKAAAKKTHKAAAKRPKAGTGQKAADLRKFAFAQAYIANGGNATEAAKTAGYSPATARQQGSRLLSDVAVAQLIAESARAAANRYQLTTDMVTKSIVQELSFDPAKLYREDGSLKDVPELDEDTRMALASMETATEGNARDGFTYVRKIKWAARQGAREQAMKHLGMFERDNNQKSALAGMAYEAMEEARAKLVQLLASHKKG